MPDPDQPPPPAPPPADPRLRDAYLAELWPVCRELPYGDRAAKRADDRRQQRQLEEQQLEHDTAHLRAAG